MEGGFDIVVLGTGLTESITAAALSKAGYTVAHIDVNAYYGANEASLSFDELIQWADERSLDDSLHAYTLSQKAAFTSISKSTSTLPQSRQYALSLTPSLIPSVGPLISSLISSGVARYGGYRLLERVGIYDPSGTVKDVPGSKEEIFKNRDINLVDKRRLMRFLMFAAGEFENTKELEGRTEAPFIDFLKVAFSLTDELAGVISYALAFCVAASDATLPALLRIRHNLRSAGRYGASPFLVGHYGGAGEIAQGFCRVAAVAGAVYILGRRVKFINSARQDQPSNTPSDVPSSCRYSVELEDFPEKLTCNLIISSSDLLPPSLRPIAKHVNESLSSAKPFMSVARCIAIIDKPIHFSSLVSPAEDPERAAHVPDVDEGSEIDTAIVIFPPASLPGGSATTSVHVMITGEGSMSTPSGKWIIYISMPIFSEVTGSPESILRPYLDAALKLTVSASLDSPSAPLFTSYYLQHASTSSSPSQSSPVDPPSTILVTPSLNPYLAELADSAATNAESVFWDAIQSLRSSQSQSASIGKVPSAENFWPPIVEQSADEQDEEW